eukprot:scaffold76205_cov59-Phaeocystis_antarctica.AAC.3
MGEVRGERDRGAHACRCRRRSWRGAGARGSGLDWGRAGARGTQHEAWSWGAGRGAWVVGRRCAPPLEGQHAAEQHEGEHAQRPHVHGLAVALAREQLGRAVARRAAARGKPPLLHRTQAEVGELDLGSGVGLGLGSGLGSGFGLWVRARVLEVGGRDVELIARLDEEQILRLDVSVDDVDVVQVVHRSDHLVRGRGRVSDAVQVVHGSDHLSTPATPGAQEQAVGREWRWGAQRWGGSGGEERAVGWGRPGP